MRACRNYRFTIWVLAASLVFGSLAGCGKEAALRKEVEQKIETGKALMAKKMAADAINEFKAAVGLDPKNAQGQYELGLAYMKARQYREAGDAVVAAIALKQKDPRLYNALGLIYEKEGSFDSARKAFQQALQLNRKFEEARENLLKIEDARAEYNFYKFAMSFIYRLSAEYSNGNNSFRRGISDTKEVRTESGNLIKYEVSSEIYLAKEYFDKCSNILEDLADKTGQKPLTEIIDAFSMAIQLRLEAVDLQIQGYTLGAAYSGEFEKAEAKTRIADTYYADAARRLEAMMVERPALFDEKDVEKIKYLIKYYSEGDRSKDAEVLR